MELTKSLSLVNADDIRQKLTHRMGALSAPSGSRRAANLMKDDSDDPRSVEQHHVNSNHLHPSPKHCPNDVREYPETSLARQLVPPSYGSDTRAIPTPDPVEEKEESTAFAMHNSGIGNSSNSNNNNSSIGSSLLKDSSSSSSSSSSLSSSPLRDLVSNEFGLTLLAPLGDEQLWSFERSELYLADESPDRTTKSTSSPNNRMSSPSSVTMITLSTTQEPDSSLEDEEEEERDDDDHNQVRVDDEQQQQLQKQQQQQQEQDINDTDHLVVQVLPEPADDLQFCPRILTANMMQQIHAQLPEALQQNKWDRCFAIGRDGDSFVTLLECCKEYQFTVIVIRTLQGHVLGGFASQSWSGERNAGNKSSSSSSSSSSYYGTGQSFLFASHPAERLPGDAEPVVVAPAATANNNLDTIPEEQESLSFFSWTGSNDYCQICNVDKLFLCMGGEGAFGWIIQDNFERGQSGRCRTYSNPPLVPGDTCFGGHFEIADFEIYGLQPLFSTLTPNSSSRSSRSWLSIRGF